jgi:Ricin-type beta-trefoil lectin domain
MGSLKGRQRWWVTGGLLAAVGLFVTLALHGFQAVPAKADTGGALRNSATGLCLAGFANGFVNTAACGAVPSALFTVEMWQETFNPDGSVTLTNASDNQCLENDSPGYVYTESCTGGLAQEWAVSYRLDGSTGYCNIYTGACLDSNANGYTGNVYTDPGNGDANQGWGPIPE